VPPKPPKIQPHFSARGPRILSFYNCHHPGTGCPTLRGFRSVGTTDENSSHQISTKPRVPLSCAIIGKGTSSTSCRQSLPKSNRASAPEDRASSASIIATTPAPAAPRFALFEAWAPRTKTAPIRFRENREPHCRARSSGRPRVPLVPLKSLKMQRRFSARGPSSRLPFLARPLREKWGLCRPRQCCSCGRATWRHPERSRSSGEARDLPRIDTGRAQPSSRLIREGGEPARARSSGRARVPLVPLKPPTIQPRFSA
jgi:hypothetical protein